MSDLWELEYQLAGETEGPVCGVDEAGRGPLAGPVCAAAVLLPPGLELPGLDDSKKLSEARREALYDLIVDQAVSFGIAFATVEEIETHNILGATYLAMNRAIEALEPAPVLALIDGNRAAGICRPCRTVVRGQPLCQHCGGLYPRQGHQGPVPPRTGCPVSGIWLCPAQGLWHRRPLCRPAGARPCPVHRPSFLKKMH